MPSGKRRNTKGGPSAGPGRIYELFYRKQRSEEREAEKPADYEKFVEMCRKTYEKGRARAGKLNVSQDLRAAVDFLGWDLPPEAIEFTARQYALYVLIAGYVLLPFVLAFVFPDYIYWPPDLDAITELVTSDFLFWFFVFLPVMLAGAVYYSFISYPVSLSRSLFQRDLLPSLRVIGNIVLSMKLVPNLEKAISFAVEHGKGFLAETLKQVLWDTQLGIYATVEEGLDKVAYRLGRYSDEFKHAIMRIRTSLLEADDAKRYILLDGALHEAVDGVRRRMVDAAASLQSPSIQLFYLGIFLPLLLFIVLPVGAAFSKNSMYGNPIFIMVTFNVVLPIATYYFAKAILAKRPNAYTVPDVPDALVQNYAAVKRRAALEAIGILLVGVGAAYFLHTLLDTTVDSVLISNGVCTPDNIDVCKASLTEDQLNYYLSVQDLTPYVLIFGSILSAVSALAVYLYEVSRDKLRIQSDVMAIEKEFKDALYVLASRMGEGKPLENALDAVSENMPESKIATVFQRISYNVRNLGLTVEDAVFSPVFGVMRDLPSRLLYDAMRLMVAAVSLGTELASRALAALSEQLRNEQDVVERIREKTGEIAAMMLTMAYFVGPIVLGITVALEKVIVSSVSNMSVGSDLQNLRGTPGVPEQLTNAVRMLGNGANGPKIPDWAFLLSVSIYTVEVTALLVWFATYLHDGPNRPALYRKLGFALVIAVLFFSVSAWLSIQMIKGMM